MCPAGMRRAYEWWCQRVRAAVEDSVRLAEPLALLAAKRVRAAVDPRGRTRAANLSACHEYGVGNPVCVLPGRDLGEWVTRTPPRLPRMLIASAVASFVPICIAFVPECARLPS